MKYIILFLLFFNTLIATEKKFSIGIDPHWATQTFGPLSHSITGFTHSLLEELEGIEGASYKLSEMSTSFLLHQLEKGELDGVFTHLPPTKELQEKYHFSTPFVFLGPVLVVKQDNSAKSLKQLKGKIVGLAPDQKSAQSEGIKIKNYSSTQAALHDLLQGKIEGVLIGTLEAHALVPHQYAGRLRIATKPLNDNAIRLITMKGKNKALLSPFNLGVKKLKKKGIYTRLRLEFGTI